MNFVRTHHLTLLALAIAALFSLTPVYAQTASCNALSANMGPSSSPSPYNVGGAQYQSITGGGGGGTLGSDSAAQAACQQMVSSKGTSGVCEDQISYQQNTAETADPSNPACQTSICLSQTTTDTWTYYLYPGVTSIVSSPQTNTTYGACGAGSTCTTIGTTNNSGICAYTAPSTPKPTVTIITNPTTIQQGQGSNVGWTSSNATSCTGTNFTPTGTSGSVVVHPSSTTNYYVTCTGPGGSTTAGPATVTVTAVPGAPSCTISVSPSTITQGQSATLSWTFSNSSTISITPGVGTESKNGSTSVNPSTSVNYTGSVSNGSTNSTCSAPLTVQGTPPPPPPGGGSSGSCVSYQGQSCTVTSAANSCGMTSTNNGTYGCDGTCSAPTPTTPSNSLCGGQPATAEIFMGTTGYNTTATYSPGTAPQMWYACGYSQTWGTYAATVSPGNAITSTSNAPIQGYNSNGDAIVYGDGNPRYLQTTPLYNTTTFTLTCYSSYNSAPAYAQATAYIQGPDLTAGPPSDDPGSFPATGFTVPASNSLVNLYSVITNQGNGATGGMFADIFYLSNSSTGSSPTNLSGTYDGPKNAGDTLKAQTSYAFNTPGTYYLEACSDASNAIAETNENNNCSAWTPVYVLAQPDLTATNSGNVSGVTGSTVTLNGTVSNASGTAAPSGGFWNLLQFCDSNCATVNNTSNESWISSMAAGPSSGTVSSNYVLPSTAGTYYYRWCANNNTAWQNIVTESNYGNNCSGWSTVTVSPPVSGSCSVSPASGQSISPQTLFTWSAYPTGGDGNYTYAWSGTDGLTGSNSSASMTYSTSGTKTGSVQITSAGQTATISCSNNATVSSCGTASASLTATPTRLKKGDNTDLYWAASNVKTSCVVSDNYGNTLSTSTPPPNSCSIPNGHASVQVNKQTIYKISCDGATAGQSGYAQVIVNVVPALNEF